MKRNLFVGFLGLAAAVALTACGGAGGAAVKKRSTPIKSLAVVSVSVSDWGGSVKGGSVGSQSVNTLIDNSMGKILGTLETKLAKDFQVKKSETFVADAGYQKLGVKHSLSVFVPTVKKKEMPLFTAVSKELKAGQVSPEVAKQLCALLKVDGIVFLFSEWTAKTGGIVPTTKAVTKNVFTVWDRDGNLAAKKRIDMIGEKTLGAYGFKAVNKETIDEWTDTTSRSLDKIISSPDVQDLKG